RVGQRPGGRVVGADQLVGERLKVEDVRGDDGRVGGGEPAADGGGVGRRRGEPERAAEPGRAGGEGGRHRGGRIGPGRDGHNLDGGGHGGGRVVTRFGRPGQPRPRWHGQPRVAGRIIAARGLSRGSGPPRLRC